jgi:hypothetical protein
MNKDSLLKRLENIRVQAENEPATPEFCKTTSLQVLDELLSYINNPEIREKVEEIPL